MLSCRAAILHGHAGEDRFISCPVGLRLTTAVTVSVTTRAWMGTDNLKLKHGGVYKPRISP